MKKHVFGRKLKRDINERKALFKGLLDALIIQEEVITTQAKAKSVKGLAEKLVTKAKLRGEESRRYISSYLSPVSVEKVVKDLSVRFAERPGGYTRIIKLGNRFSDNAPMAVLQWVEKGSVIVGTSAKSKKEKNTKVKAETAVKTAKTAKKPAKVSSKKPEKKAAGSKPKTKKKK